MTLQGGPVSSASKVMGAMMTASNTDVMDMLTASATLRLLASSAGVTHTHTHLSMTHPAV